MLIKEIKNKDYWENFLLSQPEPPFLQSWYWGKFHKSLGDKIFRLGIFDNEEIVGAALIIRVLARRGSFLFCPYGPIISQESKVKSQKRNSKCKSIEILTNYLKDLARKEKCCFLRISPNWERSEENIKIFKDLGFRDAPIHLKPEITWLLDIRPSEDEILMGMRKTTRNLIRRGYKEDIQIIKSENPDDLDEFYKIYQKTAKRQNFVPFSKEYLKKEFSVFAEEKKVSLFFAKHKDKLLAASFFIFYGRQGFYHHSASLPNTSKISTSYLLLWKAIQEAKKRNCEIFNFWGIAPKNKPKHPWQGLTFFKKGFGGYQKDLIHAQDLPMDRRYWLNWMVETFRRIKRGYS